MKTVANVLTWYRIVAAPFAVLFAVLGYRHAFFILLIASLASDLLDGPLARWSGKATPRGAKLDTIGDGLTTLVGLLGIYIFEAQAFRTDLPWLYAFLSTYVVAALACLTKFRELPAYHLYLSKLGAVLAGLFVVWLYLIGYSGPFLIAVVCIGILANLESLLATFKLRSFQADIGSVLLLRKQSRNGG